VQPEGNAAAVAPPPEKDRLTRKKQSRAGKSHAAHTLPAPHYVQRLVKGYQKYWLN
jgi:hypothetical protein